MFGNIIVGFAVALMIFGAAYSVYKNRKRGRCCGCDSSCPHSGSCPASKFNQ